MNPDTLQSLPFLTRKMLSFEHGVAFGLRIMSQSGGGNVLTIRGATREGLFAFRHTTTGDLGLNTENFRLPDIPIFVSVIDETLELTQGEVYASLSITANGDKLFDLCSGLVYGSKSISWPATATQDALPAHGTLRTFESADPAAGAEISHQISDHVIWKFRAASVRLVAAAVAVSRRVHLVFTTTDGLLLHSFASIDQTTGQTIDYSFAEYGAVTDETDNGIILVPTPGDLYLPPLTTISTLTTNLDPGDNFGTMKILAEEILWD